jgi:hypothetical protein
VESEEKNSKLRKKEKFCIFYIENERKGNIEVLVKDFE